MLNKIYKLFRLVLKGLTFQLTDWIYLKNPWQSIYLKALIILLN